MTILNALSSQHILVEEDLSDVIPNTIIDLTHDGCRWEGGRWNDQPFGWGRLYNERNIAVYEGFMIGDKYIGLGTEFHKNSFNQQITYYGTFMNNRRFGYGLQYNLHGELEYEGQWRDDNPVEYNDKLTIIPDQLITSMFIETLIIGTYEYNNDRIQSLIISLPFCRLTRIEIGPHSFQNVRRFELCSLNCLENVVIGSKSLQGPKPEGWENSCRISNCPNLKEVVFGEESFTRYASFQMSSLNALQRIDFGKYCFWTADLFLHGI